MTFEPVSRRQRRAALAAAVAFQALVGLALLNGFDVTIDRASQPFERLIAIALPPPKPPPPPRIRPPTATRKAGSSPVRAHIHDPVPPRHAAPSRPTPTLTRAASPTPVTGGAGSAGSGSGTGSGTGPGAGSGGGELELIAGDITPRDYPRDLGNRGVGGRVSVRFTVEPSGRADRCAVTRSSGIAELDSLTCRLIEARFRFRPSTDRLGRPIADQVDFDQDWDASR